MTKRDQAATNSAVLAYIEDSAKPVRVAKINVEYSGIYVDTGSEPNDADDLPDIDF